MVPSTNPADNIETLADNVITAMTALAKSKSKLIRKDNVLHAYHQAARWIPLGLDPFSEPTQLFIELEEQDSQSMSAERKSFKNKYPMIFKIIKYFISSSRDDDLTMFMLQMGTWACGARNEDTAMAKKLAVEILRPYPDKDFVFPPLSSTHKLGRGFNHPMTARLLCPRKHLELFDSNPQDYMSRVNDNEIEILATDFPAFMYDESIPYDPENEQSGLFRGYYALRVFRAIFTGSSSAMDKVRNCAKRSKSESHGMITASPETLAYSCVHARFSLSSTTSWSPYDGTFDMVAFYHLIVSLLGDLEDEEVEEVLKYWTNETPNLRRAVKKVRKIVQDKGICADKIQSMLAQRAKRKAAQQAAAQEANRGAGSSNGGNRGQRGGRRGDSGDEEGGLEDEGREGGDKGEGGDTTAATGVNEFSEEEDKEGEEDEEDEEEEDEDGDGHDPRASSSLEDDTQMPPSEHAKEQGGSRGGSQGDGGSVQAVGTATFTDGNSRTAGTASDSEEALLPPSPPLKRREKQGSSGKKGGDHMPTDDRTTKKSVRLAKQKATCQPGNFPPRKKAKKS